MEKENIIYYINFVRNNYSGNRDACNRFIEENLQPAVNMMDKYTKDNNQWWLNKDANMAYHQLKEISTIVVEYPSFIDALSRLLDRPIQSFEIGKNYTSLLQQANESYTNYMRNEIAQRYHIDLSKSKTDNELNSIEL